MSITKFGIYGGQYIPEILMNEIIDLEKAYNYYKKDPEFLRELDNLLKKYAGRPSLLYFAENMTKDLGGAKIFWGRFFLQNIWGKNGLLLKRVQGSTVLPLQLLRRCWVLSVKYLWVKRILTGRH